MSSKIFPSPIGEDDDTEKKQPDRKGDSNLAIPQQEGNPKPLYPALARRRGYEGTVRLKVEVLTSGKVGRIWVKQSSGYEILDRSALKTVNDWRFIPARFGGIPVKSTVIIPVTFQLED
jgi:protein TonB